MLPQGDYLNDLRTNRVQRPQGSRPAPQSSLSGRISFRERSHGYGDPPQSKASSLSSRYGSLVGRSNTRLSSGKSQRAMSGISQRTASSTSRRTASTTSRRTVSGASNASQGSEEQKLPYKGYNNDPERQMEREEAHEMRLALEQLDMQEDEGIMVSKQDNRRRSSPFELEEMGLAHRHSKAVVRVEEDDGAESYAPTHLNHVRFTNESVTPTPQQREARAPMIGPRARTPCENQGLAVGKQRSTSTAKIANMVLHNVTNRRRSSGARIASGSRRKSSMFANPDDKIFEDPGEQPQSTEPIFPPRAEEGMRARQPSKQKPLLLEEDDISPIPKREASHLRRNPFARARTSKHSLPHTASDQAQQDSSAPETRPKSILRRNLSDSSKAPDHVAGQHTSRLRPQHVPEQLLLILPPTLSEDLADSLPGTLSSPGRFLNMAALPNKSWSTLPKSDDSTSYLLPSPLRPGRTRSTMGSRDPMKTATVPLVPVVSIPPRSTERDNRNTRAGSCDQNLIPALSINANIPAIAINDSPVSTTDTVSLTNFPLPPSITITGSGPGTTQLTVLPTFTITTDKTPSVSTPQPAHHGRNMPSPNNPSRRNNLHVHPHARTNDLCDTCALPVSGKSIIVSTARFHPSCFICYHCGTGLECIDFYPEPESHRTTRLKSYHQHFYPNAEQLDTDGEPEDKASAEEVNEEDGDEALRFYCHLDFHEFFAPTCRHCKTPILGNSIQALGSAWHEGHFFCAQCGDVSPTLYPPPHHFPECKQNQTNNMANARFSRYSMSQHNTSNAMPTHGVSPATSTVSAPNAANAANPSPTTTG